MLGLDETFKKVRVRSLNRAPLHFAGRREAAWYQVSTARHPHQWTAFTQAHMHALNNQYMKQINEHNHRKK